MNRISFVSLRSQQKNICVDNLPMRQNIGEPTSNKLAMVIILWAFIFGAFVRLYPIIIAKFPINDGGLFYIMVEDLINNGLKLPSFVSYNGGHIPYTYPPLVFYLLAIINKVFGLSTFDLLKYLPAIISTLSIVVYFFLANDIFQDRFQAALATVTFSLMPNSFTWIIMGGGVTRSIGILFHILFIIALRRFFRSWKLREALLVMVLLSLIILTHPSWALNTLFICIVLWLFWGKRKLDSTILFILIGIILITFPWWIWILKNHGLSPLISASQTGFQHPLLSFLLILTFDFAEEPYLDLISVIALLGMIVTISKKNYLFFFGS